MIVVSTKAPKCRRGHWTGSVHFELTVPMQTVVRFVQNVQAIPVAVGAERVLKCVHWRDGKVDQAYVGVVGEVDDSYEVPEQMRVLRYDICTASR